MKLSELQELLEMFKIKFGDLEIVRYYIDEDEECPILKNNFSATQDSCSKEFENIRFWV